MKPKGTPLANREDISALVDGESKKPNAKIMIASVSHGQEQFVTWERYLLIGEIMRKSMPPQIVADYSLVSRVSTALEEEPTVIRPRWRRVLDKFISKFKNNTEEN